MNGDVLDVDVSVRSSAQAMVTTQAAEKVYRSIGPDMEIIVGEGKIITAGGIDSHIHFISSQQIDVALNSGISTMLGGGTKPSPRRPARGTSGGCSGPPRVFR